MVPRLFTWLFLVGHTAKQFHDSFVRAAAMVCSTGPAVHFYWKRMVRQEGGALSPCHYGLLVGAAFLLWVPLSLIMGLGPCYRYVLIESGSFGGMILSIVTLPLLFFETVGIIVVMKMPVLLLTFTGIGFSIGTVFAYTKRRFARHNLSKPNKGK